LIAAAYASLLANSKERNKKNAKRSKGGSPVQISGKTIDGKFVVRGVHYIVSSIGLPLELCIEFLQKHNMVVDWVEYYTQSVKDCGKPDRVMEKIRGALQDTCDKEIQEKVIERLQFFVQYGTWTSSIQE
jgi:hypothetical protein